MVAMDASVYMAIKLTFKVYWHYEKMGDLAKKLGVERELKQEGFHTQFIPSPHPRVEFELWNADKRAIFIHSEPSDDNLYSLIVPDNRLLYSKVYALLKAHNLSIKARMVEFPDTGVPSELTGLLKRY